MDVLKFAQNAMKSVMNGGGAEQPEWLRRAVAERLKARDGDAAQPAGDSAPDAAGDGAKGGAKEA